MKIDEELLGVGKRLGLRLRRILDRLFLFNLLEDVVESIKDVARYVTNRQFKSRQPVDWNLDVASRYEHEASALLLQQADGKWHFLGQSLLVDAAVVPDAAGIVIAMAQHPFADGQGSAEALKFYESQARERGKELFDGTLAGVSDWDPVQRRLTFRRCTYYQFLRTNLALDFRDPLSGSLRERVSADGRLEPLSQSRLANPSGVNGLIFTNDGYMVIQERLPQVMIRANELCSGFSGTLNGTDIEYALARHGGASTLADINVCREMEEEIGVRWSAIRKQVFLGITREMLRGGMTEFFYAVEIDLSHEQVLRLVPKDKEGVVKVVHLGSFAACCPDVHASHYSVEGFWSIVSRIKGVGKGIISVPLLTNLALWYRSLCPSIMREQRDGPAPSN